MAATLSTTFVSGKVKGMSGGPAKDNSKNTGTGRKTSPPKSPNKVGGKCR